MAPERRHNEAVSGLGDEASTYLEEMDDGHIGHWLSVRTGNATLDIGLSDGHEINGADTYADYAPQLRAVHRALTGT